MCWHWLHAFIYSICASMRRMWYTNEVCIHTSSLPSLLFLKGLRSDAHELKDRLTSKKKHFFSTPEVKLLVLSVLLVVVGVIILGRFTYILATQAQYAHHLSEYSICQLQGSKPNCTPETAISSVSISSRILTVAAIGVIPCMNMIFLVGKSDFVRMASLLCCVCKQTWSCQSASVDGELPAQHEVMGNSPTEEPEQSPSTVIKFHCLTVTWSSHDMHSWIS